MPARPRPAGRSSPRGRRSPSWRLGLAVGSVAAVVLVVAAALLLARSGPGAGDPSAISSVETEDVHALAFMDGSERVILGHHGGILESTDGGRTWSAWGAGSDAMALGVAADRPLVVAGHHILAIATPAGRWDDIKNDLPHTDIHGFARDPHDADRMWAYLATGGLYESDDGGRHWQSVFGGHTFALLAVPRADATRLLAVVPEHGGIAASQDGGRTWQPVGVPPTTPVYAMAAGRGGDTLLFSGSDGLFRSDDGGATFSSVLELDHPILAVAVTSDAGSVLVATRDRSIYRSDDGGNSWQPAR